MWNEFSLLWVRQWISFLFSLLCSMNFSLDFFLFFGDFYLALHERGNWFERESPTTFYFLFLFVLFLCGHKNSINSRKLNGSPEDNLIDDRAIVRQITMQFTCERTQNVAFPEKKKGMRPTAADKVKGKKREEEWKRKTGRWWRRQHKLNIKLQSLFLVCATMARASDHTPFHHLMKCEHSKVRNLAFESCF